MHLVQQQVEVTLLRKGKEAYIFVYAKEHKWALWKILVRWACDSRLSFSWLDVLRVWSEL